MSAIACCHEGCGASVCFSPEINARLRQTHEWWVCPFGHRQHFTKETDDEERLRHEQEVSARWRRRLTELREEFGTCPFGCGWRSYAGTDRLWLQMFKHFSKAHGNLLPKSMIYHSRRENWPKERAS